MLKRLQITQFLFFCISCISINAQDKISKLNLDFEQVKVEEELPEKWFIWGNGDKYDIQVDSVSVYSGKYAVSVSEDGADSNAFGCIAYKIPAGYRGKIIRLEGYIKVSNVNNGFAGLLLRLNKGRQTLAFDNMLKEDVKGTHDWKKYTITLPFHEDADAIYVGGILSGKGKAWFDNFKISIDNNYVETLELTERPLTKAEKDKEFIEGSKFKIKDLTKKHISNLSELCIKWGHFKYHNQDIAQGNYNWDYELFRILPAIKSNEFKTSMNNWERSFGVIDSVPLKTHYYVDFAQGVGNPIFQNEMVHGNMDWTDDGYKLLSLFRYWNIIKYFFPYKHLIEKDWDKVLKEYIPKVVETKDELSFKLVLLQLIGEIHDTHANIWQFDKALDSFYGHRIVPLELSFVEDRLTVVGFYEEWNADKSIIRKGDIIEEINKIPVSELTKEKIKYCPASNYVTQLREVAKRLLRTNDGMLEVTFSNDLKTYTEKIITVPVNKRKQEEDKASHNDIGNNIGYIYPGSLAKDEIHAIIKNFMDKEGIIIDLRCYPSDFIVFKLGEYLMPNPVEFVKFSNTSLNNLGEFKFTDPLKIGKKNPEYYKGKIAILVNEKTQSQAEYTAMALRKAPRAKIIGSQTAGADGNVSEIYLPGNTRTMISGIGVYYPDGTDTQRVGILPDIEIQPTIDGIRNGKDEVLERAIKYIKTGK